MCDFIISLITTVKLFEKELSNYHLQCKPKYLGKLLRVMASNTDTLYSQFLKPLLFYSQEVVLHLHSNTFNVWWDKETFMILLLKITWWLILCLQVLCVVDIQISGLVKTGARSTKLVQGKCMTFHNFSIRQLFNLLYKIFISYCWTLELKSDNNCVTGTHSWTPERIFKFGK